MNETLNRQSAIDQLDDLKVKLGISDEEVEFLMDLVQQAETAEELNSIIEDTAITHDPAQDEERSWPW